MTDTLVNGVKELCPGEVKSGQKSDGKSEKLMAQEKLQDCIKDLQRSLDKTKEAFGSFKTKCFFFPEPEFNKSFKEALHQVESAVDDMGNRLTNILSVSKKSGVKERGGHTVKKSPPKNEQIDSSYNLGTEQADALAKVNLNITPPASEAGLDDELATVTQQPATVTQQPATVTQQPAKTLGNKRNRIEEDDSEKVIKKPRRSLLDDYFCKTKVEASAEATSDATSVATETKETKDAPAEESEYEVETIITCKKTHSKFYYQVSWKGYGMDDCTWEPSEHLTDCSEVLLDFYKRKLIEREKLSTETEMNNQVLAIDRDLQHYLREAFLKYIVQPTKEDRNRIFKQASLKVPMKKVDLNELVDKALTARKTERYNAVKFSLREQVLLQTVQKDRSKQQAQLRTWERDINSVCSDPAKIVVENEVDLELPPLEFVYINELKEGQGVTIPNDPVLGCECEDCFSNPKSCCASQMNSWFAYNKYGRLKISLGTPIYECNKVCPCPLTCNNRVVQKGRTFNLSIFRTPNGRGWGVKALEPIKKDSFVVEYVGEVITSEEAEHRGELYDQKGCTYLFDLDFNKGDQNPYTVDAAKFGNVSHFINHSCDPNLVVFNVWVNCLDPDLPRLALFTCRDIKKGEELTFDYNSGLESEQIKMEASGILTEELSEDEDTTTPEKPALMKGINSSFILKTPKGNRGLKYGKTECRCGAANCRKYFF